MLSVHFILLLIIFTCLIQSLIGILQYFDVLNGKNDFFKLLGSFRTPNFFGVYLGFGFIILIWYLFIIKTKKNILFVLCFFGILLFTILIILSNSRGTWLSILVALTVLAFTSKKVITSIKKLSVPKLVFGSLIIVFLCFFGSKYLYALKPESVNGRAFTTQITLQEIMKQPIKGHGLFTFAGKYNKAKADYFIEQPRPWGDMKIAIYSFSAFNDYLLIAFELGVLVLIVLLALVIFVFKKLKITPETRIGLGLFVTLCIFAMFNSPIHNPYIMSVGLLGFALILKFGELNLFSIKLPFSLKNITLAVVFFAGCLGLYAVSTKTINQKKFKDYSIINDSLDVKKVVCLNKSTDDNLFSEYILGKKLYDNGFKNEGIAHMEKAFKKSYAPKIGKQLAFCYIKEGDYKKAETIFRFNIHVEPYRYEPRMDLLMFLHKFNRHKEVFELSKEIINLPVKIPSKEIEKFKKTASKYVENYSRTGNTNIKGSLSNLKIIKSTVLNKSLLYKIYLPPLYKVNKKLPVIYINDGDNYIKKASLPKVLDSLISNDIIEPVVAVFLEPRDEKENWRNIRQELFLCNPLFVSFFTNEFIPTIEKLYTVSNHPNDRSIMGVSFGGLAAAYIADNAPNTFKNVIMQSPAFHPCKDIYNSFYMKPKKDFKMYLSYGTGKDTEKQDIPFIQILKNKGYNLKINRVEGANHEWSVWQEQLDDILVYFFNKKIM
ncbi:alpha/beta hydrolase-fold protein [Mariniflexile jejuense]